MSWSCTRSSLMALGSRAGVRRLFLSAGRSLAPVTGEVFKSHLLTVALRAARDPSTSRPDHTSRTRGSIAWSEPPGWSSSSAAYRAPAETLRGSHAVLAMIAVLCSLVLGRTSWTVTRTLKHPFEPSSKRRRGFPLASPASSVATASSASTPNSSRRSAGTTRARAVRAAAFRRCCRRTGRFDGTQGNYYVRDQEDWRNEFTRRGSQPRRVNTLTCRRQDDDLL